MRHPFLRPLKNFYLYLSVWAIILALHTFLLAYIYKIPFIISFADAIIFNLLLSGACLGIWFAVVFVKIDKNNKTTIFLNHLVTALFLLGIWLLIGYYILNNLFTHETLYLYFLKNSLLLRLLTGLLFYSATILFYYLYIFYNSYQENKLKEANLQSLVKGTQLELLKSQINPHFIFNSLNSVSSLTMSNPEKAQEMIIKLSAFLRYSLGQKDSQMVTLKKEFDNCLLYLEIEQTRFGEKLSLKNEVNHECMSCIVPEMILQPLLENAIKHGVYESSEKMWVTITCQATNDNCNIVIENNYDQQLIPRPGNGIGLKNVADRLFLLYGGDELMKINFGENIFKVTLNIPQKNG